MLDRTKAKFLPAEVDIFLSVILVTTSFVNIGASHTSAGVDSLVAT